MSASPSRASSQAPGLVVCVDIGSTWTKAALVALPTGELLATTSQATTHETDVMEGVDLCVADLERAHPGARGAERRACSSAGGGLRIAVVGHEELVSAEAGRRVALSAGGRVAHVSHGALDDAALIALVDTTPDVVLLLGGTDGGNQEVYLGNARVLVAARWRGPVVAAGNVDAHDRVEDLLDTAGIPYAMADNALPRIGELRPEPARAALREIFLSHVIGGKRLSRRDDFAEIVRGATPDVVLSAVELLAAGLGEDRPGAGDVAVLDVGGATTDVYSVVARDPEDAGLDREVVASTAANRTVEGDLGMRWSAPSTYTAALEAAVWDGPVDALASVGERRADPGMVVPVPRGADPAGSTREEAVVDEALARAALTLAARRHAGRARSRAAVPVEPERGVVDLREVALVVGSGGTLRHRPPDQALELLATVVDPDSPWQLPERARLVVDHDYVLAVAGLLVPDHPEAAYAVLDRLRG